MREVVAGSTHYEHIPTSYACTRTHQTQNTITTTNMKNPHGNPKPSPNPNPNPTDFFWSTTNPEPLIQTPIYYNQTLLKMPQHNPHLPPEPFHQKFIHTSHSLIQPNTPHPKLYLGNFPLPSFSSTTRIIIIMQP